MRSILVLSVLAACGGNDVGPRVIPGGGIGDGAIDGEVNVAVIDEDDNPIPGADVAVGNAQKTTDPDGFATFTGVNGPQTIAVKATGFRSTVWVGADGANVTIPLPAAGNPTVDQATLTGSIANWDTITAPQGHIKAAIVLYSQSDDLGDAANNLATPASGNICGIVGTTCDWTLVSRTGPVTLIAAIIDRDGNGTPGNDADDITTITGWAVKTGVTVDNGVSQNGLVLDMVEAGNLENVTVDLGTPPAGLPQVNAIVGIEISADEVAQLPLFLATDQSTLVSPKPSVVGGDTYRLSAIAQTTSGDQGAQSIVLRRGNTGTALAAGDWLVPPTNVTVTRSDASWEPVAGAIAHSVAWSDSTGESILEISVFDDSTSVTVPPLVSLPTSGTLTAKVSGIGATLDVHDFSLEEDRDKLFGFAAEPTTVP